MKDYDPEKEDKYIMYLDKNGLYTSVLAGPLPFSDLEWTTKEENDEMMDSYTAKVITIKLSPAHYV